jgi:hypothetical protein
MAIGTIPTALDLEEGLAFLDAATNLISGSSGG